MAWEEGFSILAVPERDITRRSLGVGGEYPAEAGVGEEIKIAQVGKTEAIGAVEFDGIQIGLAGEEVRHGGARGDEDVELGESVRGI